MVAHEWGSGGSTYWLAKRTAHVTAIEHSPEWATRTRAKLRADGLLDKVDLRLERPDRRSPEAFMRSDYALAHPSKKVDVIFVDGCENLPAHNLRSPIFYLAQKLIRPGGYIVVDDSWRYPVLREANDAREVHVFRGPGPTRYTSIETDIYVY